MLLESQLQDQLLVVQLYNAWVYIYLQVEAASWLSVAGPQPPHSNWPDKSVTGFSKRGQAPRGPQVHSQVSCPLQPAECFAQDTLADYAHNAWEK